MDNDNMKILTPEEQKQRELRERDQYLLDQYAGQALRGLLAANPQLRSLEKITGTVKLAWDYSEAMVKERAARQNRAAQ